MDRKDELADTKDRRAARAGRCPQSERRVGRRLRPIGLLGLAVVAQLLVSSRGSAQTVVGVSPDEATLGTEVRVEMDGLPQGGLVKPRASLLTTNAKGKTVRQHLRFESQDPDGLTFTIKKTIKQAFAAGAVDLEVKWKGSASPLVVEGPALVPPAPTGAAPDTVEPKGTCTITGQHFGTRNRKSQVFVGSKKAHVESWDVSSPGPGLVQTSSIVFTVPKTTPVGTHAVVVQNALGSATAGEVEVAPEDDGGGGDGDPTVEATTQLVSWAGAAIGSPRVLASPSGKTWLTFSVGAQNTQNTGIAQLDSTGGIAWAHQVDGEYEFAVAPDDTLWIFAKGGHFMTVGRLDPVATSTIVPPVVLWMKSFWFNGDWVGWEPTLPRIDASPRVWEHASLVRLPKMNGVPAGSLEKERLELVRFASDGSLAWSIPITDDSWEDLWSSGVVTASGSRYLVAPSEWTTGLRLCRVPTSGDVQLTSIEGLVFAGDPVVRATGDDSVKVFCMTEASGTARDLWFADVDSTGAVSNGQLIELPSGFELQGPYPGDAGGDHLLLVSDEVRVLRLDEFANPDWMTRIDSPFALTWPSVLPRPQGGCTVFCSREADGEKTELVVIELDEQGDRLWEHVLAYPFPDGDSPWVWDALHTSPDSVFVAGIDWCGRLDGEGFSTSRWAGSAGIQGYGGVRALTSARLLWTTQLDGDEILLEFEEGQGFEQAARLPSSGASLFSTSDLAVDGDGQVVFAAGLPYSFEAGRLVTMEFTTAQGLPGCLVVESAATALEEKLTLEVVTSPLLAPVPDFSASSTTEPWLSLLSVTPMDQTLPTWFPLTLTVDEQCP